MAPECVPCASEAAGMGEKEETCDDHQREDVGSKSDGLACVLED